MALRCLVHCTLACLFSLLPLDGQRAVTSLSDRSIKYRVPEKPYVVLRRGPIEAVNVDKPNL